MKVTCLNGECYQIQVFNPADQVFNFVCSQEYEGVSVATSKTEANFVQVVLTDQENGIKLTINTGMYAALTDSCSQN